MINLLVLVLSVFVTQDAKSNSTPLVSIKDPFYLGCTVWTGKAWTPVTARSAQTAEIESPKGYRAYAEVQVAVDKDGSCKNTTELFVAPAGGDKLNRKFRFAELQNPQKHSNIWRPGNLELRIWNLDFGISLPHRHQAHVHEQPRRHGENDDRDQPVPGPFHRARLHRIHGDQEIGGEPRVAQEIAIPGEFPAQAAHEREDAHSQHQQRDKHVCGPQRANGDLWKIQLLWPRGLKQPLRRRPDEGEARLDRGAKGGLR